MADSNLPMQFDGLTYYIDSNGVIWLKLENVARGLGFTKTDIKNKKEYTTIRWARVKEYLLQINLRPEVVEIPHHSQQAGKSPSGATFNPSVMTDEQIKTCFIPEPVFYVLAMKADNDIARAFQYKVAFDILPAIRRTGTYTAPTAPQISPPTGKLSAALDELNATTKRLCDIFGVNKGIALSKATALVENNYPVNLEGIKDLLPPAETDVGLLNPTQIRDMLGYDISPQFINRNLIELGLQKQVKNGYQLTEAGKEFGEMMPYTRNGHSGYRPLWRTSIIAKLREHITPCDVVAEKIFGEE